MPWNLFFQLSSIVNFDGEEMGLGGMDDGKWWGFFPYRKKIYIQLITCGEGVFLCGRFQQKKHVHTFVAGTTISNHSGATLLQQDGCTQLQKNIFDRGTKCRAFLDRRLGTMEGTKKPEKLMKTHGFFSEIDGSYSICWSFRGSMDRRFWIFLDNIQGCSSMFFFGEMFNSHGKHRDAHLIDQRFKGIPQQRDHRIEDFMKSVSKTRRKLQLQRTLRGNL